MTRYAGMIHPFFALPGMMDDGRTAMTQVTSALRLALGVGN